MKPPGYKSIRTAEIYSHLSDKHLHGIVGQLPSLDMGADLGAIAILPGRADTHIVVKEVMGDREFEPLTSPACSLRKKGRKRKKYGISPIKIQKSVLPEFSAIREQLNDQWSSYSYLNEATGSARAARTAWKTTDNSATAKARAPDRRKTSSPKLIR